MNKAKVMPFETLLKVCTDFYSGEAIQGAKEVLWESVISIVFPARKDLCLIKRKATSIGCKERADLDDILKALQVCDKEVIVLPQFYALDLGNIPPASPEQVDMSVLLAQFSVMQGDMQGLKQAVQALQDQPKEPKTTATWADVASVSPPSHAMPARRPSQPWPQQQQKKQKKQQQQPQLHQLQQQQMKDKEQLELHQRHQPQKLRYQVDSPKSPDGKPTERR